MIEPIRLAPKPGQTEYRELTPEEIGTVAHVFLDSGNPMPPQGSVFVGGVRDGSVIGFVVLQAKLHAEPMWIAPGQSNSFSMLAKKAEEVILQKCGPTWVYLYAPAGKVSQMASVAGFMLEPWNIYSKLVMPEAPGKQVVDLMPVEPFPEAPPVTAEEMEQYPEVEAVQ